MSGLKIGQIKGNGNSSASLTEPSGVKYDGGKPRMDLLVPEAELLTAMVFTFGAAKYGNYNWQGGINYSRLHASLRRHLAEWAKGVDIDEESGLPHLAHASCNLQMLMWMGVHRTDLDDRPTKVGGTVDGQK